MDHPPTETRNARSIAHAFGLLALASLSLGLGLYLFGARFGLDEPTSRLVASAFIVAGVLDACVLYFWERLFGSRT